MTTGEPSPFWPLDTYLYRYSSPVRHTLGDDSFEPVAALAPRGRSAHLPRGQQAAHLPLTIGMQMKRCLAAVLGLLLASWGTAHAPAGRWPLLWKAAAGHLAALEPASKPAGPPAACAGKPPVLSVNPHVPALLAYDQMARQQVGARVFSRLSSACLLWWSA